jgi:hypothetical protein
MTYQYALKEYRAKVALEREIERNNLENELLLKRAEMLRDQSDWTKRGFGKFLYVMGYIFALLFEGLVILMKWIVTVYRAQSKSQPVRKEYKGVVGQIDDLGRTPFVTQNAAVRSRRRL